MEQARMLVQDLIPIAPIGMGYGLPVFGTGEQIICR
jgi:hypothetical protein